MKIILSILLAFVINTAVSQDSEFDKITQLIQDQKFEKAIKKLDSYLEENNPNPLVYWRRAECYFKLNEFEMAIIDFKKANFLDPKNPNLTFNIGLCQSNMKKYSLACDTYRQALKEDLEDTGIDLGMAESMGACFYFGCDMPNAEKFLKLAIRLGSTDSAIPNDLAWTYTQTGKFKEAIKLFKNAYDLDPFQYQNVNNLGYAYILDNQLEKAEGYILEAKKLNSKNSFVYRNLGLIRMKQENKKEACEYLQQAIDLSILEEWGEYYVEDLLIYCE